MEANRRFSSSCFIVVSPLSPHLRSRGVCGERRQSKFDRTSGGRMRGHREHKTKPDSRWTPLNHCGNLHHCPTLQAFKATTAIKLRWLLWLQPLPRIVAQMRCPSALKKYSGLVRMIEPQNRHRRRSKYPSIGQPWVPEARRRGSKDTGEVDGTAANGRHGIVDPADLDSGPSYLSVAIADSLHGSILSRESWSLRESQRVSNNHGVTDHLHNQPIYAGQGYVSLQAQDSSRSSCTKQT